MRNSDTHEWSGGGHTRDVTEPRRLRWRGSARLPHCCGCSCCSEKNKTNHVQTSGVGVAICAPLSCFQRRRVTAGKALGTFPSSPKARSVVASVAGPAQLLDGFGSYFGCASLRSALWSDALTVTEGNYTLKEEKLSWKSCLAALLFTLHLKECFGGLNVAPSVWLMESSCACQRWWNLSPGIGVFVSFLRQ